MPFVGNAVATQLAKVTFYNLYVLDNLMVRRR